jgi:methylmalonyl-CoA mutase N-terminal domain/subunit
MSKEDRFTEWMKKALEKPTRDEDFTTVSGQPVDILYTPRPEIDYERDLGLPGEYPYTRGIHDTMYRGRLWTMRLFSGFGSAKDTNRRYHFLLERGQTGLSVAFDFPTLYGRDSDDAMSHGEVGVCGVSIDTLADMETLFAGIPLDRISTSMTINGPAAVLLALYIAVGEKQGVPSHKLTGTIQNDILKEYIAQKSWIFPPQPSMRIITDILAFCKDHVPKWNTISISGYHIREAGSTAAQELAFTLADGFAYVEAGIEAGLDVDDFAPRLSFFFNAHIDLLEEVAKYRAARRIWAKRMKEKYGAKKRQSLLLRFHTQTAGCSLTAQQPENNIIRTTIEALAGVLGGTQSLHTNSMDEALALPTEKAAKIALRTQQIIAHESGVANTIDPLGGSYYVEALTSELERQAEEYFAQIEKLGGMVKAIEAGFPQKEIADAAYKYQKSIEQERKIVVGVSRFSDPEEKIDIPILTIDPKIEENQKKRLEENRRTRDNSTAARSLEQIKDAAAGNANLMPRIIDAVRARCSEGEIIGALKEVFGEYREKPVI